MSLRRFLNVMDVLETSLRRFLNVMDVLKTSLKRLISKFFSDLLLCFSFVLLFEKVALDTIKLNVRAL